MIQSLSCAWLNMSKHTVLYLWVYQSCTVHELFNRTPFVTSECALYESLCLQLICQENDQMWGKNAVLKLQLHQNVSESKYCRTKRWIWRASLLFYMVDQNITDQDNCVTKDVWKCSFGAITPSTNISHEHMSPKRHFLKTIWHHNFNLKHTVIKGSVCLCMALACLGNLQVEVFHWWCRIRFNLFQ